MLERFAVTEMPVLAGLVPPDTATVNKTEEPAATEDGFAAPVPDGLVGDALLHKLAAVELLRGAAATVKSAALLSMSSQPALFRCAELVAERVGVGPLPS